MNLFEVTGEPVLCNIYLDFLKDLLEMSEWWHKIMI